MHVEDERHSKQHLQTAPTTQVLKDYVERLENAIRIVNIEPKTPLKLRSLCAAFRDENEDGNEG